MTAAEYLSKIPAHIAEAMRARGVDVDGIISYQYSDMDKEGNFADCWIFFDKELIYILTGYDKVEKTRGNKKLKASFEFLSIDRIDHSALKSVDVERFVSTARRRACR